jgi:molecular chaperone GrpE
VIPDGEAGISDLHARIKKLKADLARSEKERREYLDGWQRAKADMVNYKKDDRRRMEDLARFASADIVQDIIGVLDNFDLALAAGAPPEVERGIMLIRGQIENIVRRQGAEEIATAAGDAFNPELHEAIGEEASDVPAGAIARVLQKGYRLHGRVVRPARVKLSKSP